MGQICQKLLQKSTLLLLKQKIFLWKNLTPPLQHKFSYAYAQTTDHRGGGLAGVPANPPILNFHRFTPRLIDEETGTLMQLEKFKAIIQELYDAGGYSLISLRDYLDGRIVVPESRKPLILSIDDAYFANQLALNEDGTPSNKSGVGWLYEFAQENPDFGFHVAMFTNFGGDKYYGNVWRHDWWYLGEGWENDLARTIVWGGMEHNVMPYNHLWRHPDLEQLADKDILFQALKMMKLYATTCKVWVGTT